MNEPRQSKATSLARESRRCNHLRVGLFRPGLAWKPRLWLGLSGLWLSQPSGRAKAIGNGLALAWPGFRPRLFKAVNRA